MISDSITLNDGVADRTFALVSREGMNSIRRETTAGVSSASQSMVQVKHTIDLKATGKPNRHLVSLTFTEYDSSGKPLPITVHAVITRHKSASDAATLKLAEMLANFIGDPAKAADLLIGSN